MEQPVVMRGSKYNLCDGLKFRDSMATVSLMLTKIRPPIDDRIDDLIAQIPEENVDCRSILTPATSSRILTGLLLSISTTFA